MKARLWVVVAFLLFAGISAGVLQEGFRPDRVLISKEILEKFLPWSAVLPKDAPHNRFLSDQAHVFYPYLMEAQRVYRGEVDALWTSRGGGGQPWFGNISSSLLHPLTLLCAFLPIHLVPLFQAWMVLTFSAFFTWMFLRKLGVSSAASAMGAVAFGFGGHQVFWLGYALSHVLAALPFTFWAIERVVERRTGRRLAVLALGFALMVLAGHPETGLVAGIVAGAWALFRLRGRGGLWMVAGAGLLALAATAVQWMPFLEYALASRGLHLRHREAAFDNQATGLGVELLFGALFLVAAGLLVRASRRGLWNRVASVAALAVTLLVALHLGMVMSAGVTLLPQLYGNPVGGGLYTAAQDFPGLNAAYVGVLLPLLLGIGCFAGIGGGKARFFGIAALLFWGTAFSVPGIEGLVRSVPGLTAVQPTRFLGPVGFLVACGGALVLDRLCRPGIEREALQRFGRVAGTLAMALVVSGLVVELQTPAVDRTTPVHHLDQPDYRDPHGGSDKVDIGIPLAEPTSRLRVRIDGQSYFDGPAEPRPGESSRTVTVYTHRIEEGVHRLVVDIERGDEVLTLADQPFVVQRARQLSTRDLGAVGVALLLLGWILSGRGARGPWLLTALVAADVLSLTYGYNTASRRDEVYPPTETIAFLQAQPGPFRIFTEGTVIAPDTQFVAGVDHILSYDNVGYMSSFRLLHSVGINWDAFAHFAFTRDTADYTSPGFDLLDVRYVLTTRFTDLSDLEGLELVHESETRIWENTGNLGRAFITPAAIDGSTTPIAELRAVDLRRTAILETKPGLSLGGTGTARVLEHTGARFRIATQTDGDALLVLAENHAPGWTASVDGGPATPTLLADIAWQAVPVPAGEHEVVFEYFPASVRWGLIISIPAGLLLLALLVLPGRRRDASGAEHSEAPVIE